MVYWNEASFFASSCFAYCRFDSHTAVTHTQTRIQFWLHSCADHKICSILCMCDWHISFNIQFNSIKQLTWMGCVKTYHIHTALQSKINAAKWLWSGWNMCGSLHTTEMLFFHHENAAIVERVFAILANNILFYNMNT